MSHVNQNQHVNNFLNLEVANDLRQFFGCVRGWMIGGNQRMETLNMGAPTIDCSFRFLFFWWFGEWKICGRHAQCPENQSRYTCTTGCLHTFSFRQIRCICATGCFKFNARHTMGVTQFEERASAHAPLDASNIRYRMLVTHCVQNRAGACAPLDAANVRYKMGVIRV